jgi:integrase/recombinase XerD
MVQMAKTPRKDLEYPEVKKWLAGVGVGSHKIYKSALRLFCEFTKLNPTQLIDEAEEDRKKSRREQGKPEARLMAWHKHLLTEYKKRGGKGRETVGVSKTRATGYFGAIRSFYRANGFPLSCKTPRAAPKKENQKLNLTPAQVKLLIDHAPTIRDRAIIAMMFQGGFDVSTLCSLNYGDVKRELEANIEPLCINVVRGKEEMEYFTFIGADSIGLLKAYLNERKQSGEELRMDSPLFAKEGYAKKTRERITTNLIQNMLREVAVKSGIVSQEEIDYADLNPARPHALRAAFSTILRLNGFDPLLIDFMQGHQLPYNGAYLIPPQERVREMYREVESQLSINEVSRSVGDLEKRLMEVTKNQARIIEEFEERIKAIEEKRKNAEQGIEEMKKVDAMVSQVLEYILQRIGSEELKEAVRETGMADKAWEREDRLKGRFIEIGTRDISAQPITTDGFQKIWQEYKKTIGSWS